MTTFLQTTATVGQLGASSGAETLAPEHLPTPTTGVGRLRSYVPSVLVLGSIAALGTWGHLTHWKLSLGHGEQHAAEEAAPSAPAEADSTTTALHQAGESSAAASGEFAEAVSEPSTPRTGTAQSPAASQPQPSTEAPAPPATGSPVTRVEFDSAAAVVKSGIQVVTVRSLPLAQTVSANGVVDYDQTRIAQLSTRVTGTVWSVEKRVGDPVQQGEVLAVIESAAVGQAKSDFLQALAQVELNERIVDRLRSLQSSVVAGKQYQQAEAELRRARVALFNSQQALVNLGLPIQLEEVVDLNESELVQRLRLLGLPPELVSRVDPSSTTANLVPLLSPFQGVVIGHDVVKGEVVSSDVPQFVVADVRRMWIKLDVRQEDAVWLRLGQTVHFSADGLPGQVSSQISWQSTEVDEKTRTVQVRCVVDNPILPGGEAPESANRLLRANTFGQGRITIQENPQALAVPLQAVQWVDNEPALFVQLDERTFEGRPVKLGVMDETYAEILSGAQAGERIASIGSHVLKSEIVRRRATPGG